MRCTLTGEVHVPGLLGGVLLDVERVLVVSSRGPAVVNWAGSTQRIPCPILANYLRVLSSPTDAVAYVHGQSSDTFIIQAFDASPRLLYEATVPLRWVSQCCPLGDGRVLLSGIRYEGFDDVSSCNWVTCALTPALGQYEWVNVDLVAHDGPSLIWVRDGQIGRGTWEDLVASSDRAAGQTMAHPVWMGLVQGSIWASDESRLVVAEEVGADYPWGVSVERITAGSGWIAAGGIGGKVKLFECAARTMSSELSCRGRVILALDGVDKTLFAGSNEGRCARWEVL